MDNKEFEQFLEGFRRANNDELDILLNNFPALSPEQERMFGDALNERTEQAIVRAGKVVNHVKLVLKIKPVTDYVSISYISRRFFGKSRSWLHNRLQGYKNNGKSDTLSPEDINTLQNALLTISDEIKSAALRLS
jgi:hypothetical protein